MSDPIPSLELLIEARRLVHANDAAMLGAQIQPELRSELMGRNRDAAMLITRFLESPGVQA